jgi:hypothetical protein
MFREHAPKGRDSIPAEDDRNLYRCASGFLQGHPGGDFGALAGF